MAVRVAPAGYYDKDGKLVITSFDFVACRDDDPYRFPGTENQGLAVIKKSPSVKTEKEDR